MRGIEKPTPLRLWGFLLTTGGGAAIALGALLPWVAVGLRSDTEGALTTTSPGIDLRGGKVCLALGVVALLAILALRVARSTNLRRLIAVGVIAAGLGAVVIGIYEASGAEDRFLLTGVRPIAEYFNRQIGLPLNTNLADKVREQLRKEGFVTVKAGLPLTIAGGAVALIGGVLDLAWVGRKRLEEVVD